MFTPPKRTTGHLKRSPVALVTREKYGADTARLHRNFFVFLPRCLVEDGSPGGRKEDMAQLWRVCTISSLLFWLAYTLNQTGSFAVALYRPTMVCS